MQQHISDFIEKPSALFCVVVLILLAGFVGTEAFVDSENRSFEAYQQVELRNREVILLNKIEREINTILQLSAGLVVSVASNSNISTQEFSEIAASLINQRPQIRSVGLAKNNVISHIYPLSGNEKALGLDLMAVPKQREAVMRAIERRATVIAGPIHLIQGGVGLVARLPIFLNGSRDSYWGLASVVIDFDQFADDIRQDSRDLGINIALKGLDGNSWEGAVFLGDDALFEEGSRALVSRVILPVGEWLLAANFSSEPSNYKRVFFLRAVGYFLSILIAFLTFSLLRAYNRQRYISFHDSLTGLANRRLFDINFERALAQARRNNSIVGLIYIDLDGFKKINDTYGHKVGDQVLVHVAKKVKAVLRESDSVARIGGDEFVVILENIKNIDNTQRITQFLEESLCMPAYFDDERLELGASMGVAIYPDHGENVDLLLSYADSQMYTIKQARASR